MTDLNSSLKREGYDLIDGSLRKQRLLQVWRKKLNNPIESLATSIYHLFDSKQILGVTTSKALDIISNSSLNLKFNIGVTALEEILTQSNLGKLDLGTKIKSGKTVNISYSNSILESVDILGLENFLFDSDFFHPNPNLLKDLNSDNLIVLTGVLYAENLKAEIESESEIEANIEAEVNLIAGGKIEFSRTSSKKIALTAPLGDTFPIALKYHRIKFNKGNFKKIKLESDKKTGFEV